MEYNIVQYVGRFHPLLVHLPIGILLIAILFGYMSRRESYSHLKGANHIVLFFGAVSATLACMTGFILTFSGEYETPPAEWHQWMGISLAAVSWIAFLAHGRKPLLFNSALWGMALLLLVTGHLGGSITHGSDFLTPPPLGSWLQKPQEQEELMPLTGETLAYAAVANIINRKCKSCHGPGKQKGKLRLDAPEHLLAGGENGVVVVAGNTAESPMAERISLPLTHEDHMPPKEKSQLSKREMTLLLKWIESGASFDQTIAALGWEEELLDELNADTISDSAINDYQFTPSEKVEAADPAYLVQLTELGVRILPVSSESNYFSARFLQVKNEDFSQALNLLGLVNEQCVGLNMAGKSLTGQDISPLAKLTNLTKLNLSGCGLSNEQLAPISGLSRLQYLNLVDNQLSLEGIMQLRNLPELKQLYLFKNMLTTDEQHKLSLVFSETVIDFGGYDVPLAAADTAKFNF